MAWNNGKEKKKFLREQREQAQQYRESGMTEEQIEAMFQFDLEQFRSERRFRTYTQPMESSDFNEGIQDDGQSTLLERFMEELSVDDDTSSEHSRYWWINMIENEKLSKVLQSVPESYLEMLTLLCIEGFSQQETALIMHVSQQAISKKLKLITKRIKKVL